MNQTLPRPEPTTEGLNELGHEGSPAMKRTASLHRYLQNLAHAAGQRISKLIFVSDTELVSRIEVRRAARKGCYEI